jgi:hypothetical protein
MCGIMPEKEPVKISTRESERGLGEEAEMELITGIAADEIDVSVIQSKVEFPELVVFFSPVVTLDCRCRTEA